MLGTFLLIISFQLFIKNQVHSEGGVIRMPPIPVFAFIGTFTGWIRAMMGIAGGPLTAAFMESHGVPVPVRVRVRYAIGTAFGFGIPTDLVAAISFILAGLDHPNRPDSAFGYVYLLAFFGIMVNLMVSARLGANFADVLAQKFPEFLFACSLEALPIHLIWNAVA